MLKKELMKKVLNTCLFCEYQWRDFPGDHAKMFMPIDKVGIKWEIRCPKCLHLYWTVDHG